MLLILFVLILLTIFYFKQKNRYWYHKNVETPDPMLIFGNMYDVVTNKVGRGQYYDKLYKVYKAKKLKYFGFYSFITPVLVVIDPDLIKCILQTDFQYFHDRVHYVNEKDEPITGHLFRLKGEKWKQLRIKLTPTFTSGKMKMMFKTVFDYAEQLRKVANRSVVNKELIDIQNAAMRYTTDVIVSCAFGVDCNTLADPNSDFLKHAKMIVTLGKLAEFKEFFTRSFPAVADLIKLKLIPTKIKKFLKDMVTQIVEARELHNIERRDFMDLLIKLKNKENISDNNMTTDQNKDDISLTLDEIVAQVFVFFLAGYETSSATLSFCFYELALNREIQEKLRNEIIKVLKESNGELTYDGLLQMTYMDMIVKETLRKYPVVSSLNRKCVKSYKVPGSNLVIEKGTNIIIPSLSVHRDEEYYPNPTIFDPERFSSKQYNCTWLAFGEGPRNCIGMRFGLMQVKIGLAALLSEYRFSVDENNPMILRTRGPFLAPQKDMMLRITKY